MRRRLIGRTWIGRMVRSLLLFYLVLNALVFYLSEQFIFQPQPASYQDSAAILKLTTADGAKISAIYWPNPQAVYTLIYSHGNGEDLGDLDERLTLLKQIGFAILAYDYRGYGTSDGKPSERNAYQDIDAAYHYVTKTLNIPPDRILLYGRSVGGGPSIDLASRQPVAGVILENTFISVYRVLTSLPIFLFDRFNNIAKLDAIKCPVLLIHGDRDQVIPSFHSRVLYQRLKTPKQFFTVEGAGHNNVVKVAGNRYKQAVSDFVRCVNQYQSQSTCASRSHPL